jgi:hypothetical protein
MVDDYDRLCRRTDRLAAVQAGEFRDSHASQRAYPSRATYMRDWAPRRWLATSPSDASRADVQRPHVRAKARRSNATVRARALPHLRRARPRPRPQRRTPWQHSATPQPTTSSPLSSAARRSASTASTWAPSAFGAPPTAERRQTGPMPGVGSWITGIGRVIRRAISAPARTLFHLEPRARRPTGRSPRPPSKRPGRGPTLLGTPYALIARRRGPTRTAGNSPIHHLPRFLEVAVIPFG